MTQTAPTTSTTSSQRRPSEISEADLLGARTFIAAAIRAHAKTLDEGHLIAGVEPSAFAEDVRKWTHTTRLREFIAANSEGLS